jgi:hypothetical protein
VVGDATAGIDGADGGVPTAVGALNPLTPEDAKTTSLAHMRAAPPTYGNDSNVGLVSKKSCLTATWIRLLLALAPCSYRQQPHEPSDLWIVEPQLPLLISSYTSVIYLDTNLLYNG